MDHTPDDRPTNGQGAVILPFAQFRHRQTSSSSTPRPDPANPDTGSTDISHDDNGDDDGPSAA